MVKTPYKCTYKLISVMRPQLLSATTSRTIFCKPLCNDKSKLPSLVENRVHTLIIDELCMPYTEPFTVNIVMYPFVTLQETHSYGQLNTPITPTYNTKSLQEVS